MFASSKFQSRISTVWMSEVNLDPNVKPSLEVRPNPFRDTAFPSYERHPPKKTNKHFSFL